SASIGHSGLANEYYNHLTSQIRRYPDLIVHRLIRTYLLKGNMNRKTLKTWKGLLPEITQHTSTIERAAIDTEREVDDLKKAEYKKEIIDETYTGIISSVTNFGIFIELENKIEELVHVSNMTNDYYNFDERHQTVIGERTRKVYRIGEEVKVQVSKVNFDEHAIDFEFVEE